MFATGARAREQFDAGNTRAAINTLSYGVGSATPGFVVQYALGKLARKLAREAQASDLIPYSEVPITAKDANYRPLMLGPGEPRQYNPYGYPRYNAKFRNSEFGGAPLDPTVGSGFPPSFDGSETGGVAYARADGAYVGSPLQNAINGGI